MTAFCQTGAQVFLFFESVKAPVRSSAGRGFNLTPAERSA
jgi:hypothetical protein